MPGVCHGTTIAPAPHNDARYAVALLLHTHTHAHAHTHTHTHTHTTKDLR